MRVAFGDCILDAGTQQLYRGERPVPLSRKAFQLLELLLRRRPHALAKAVIQEHLWPGTFVLDANLPNVVAEVRSAIGDDARQPRFIRTVHAFGYAFSGPARDLSSALVAASAHVRYYLFWEGEKVLMGEGDHLVGRSPECPVWLRSSTVSRCHARIRITGADAVLEDLGSKNGTFLRGEPVRAPVRLANDDEIKFGSVSVKFCVFPIHPNPTEKIPVVS